MKWLVSVVILLVVLLGGALIAPGFIDWNKYKEQATGQVKTLTGLDMAIDGDIDLAILPSPRIYLENVKVSDPTDAEQALASFKLLDVRVALGALLGGEVEVESIHVEEPRVRLVKDANGTFNYMTPELEAMMDKEPGAAETSKTEISIDSLVVEKGEFYYSADGKVTELKELDFDVNASSVSGPFEGNAAFMYGAQPVKVTFKTSEIDMEDMAGALNASGHYGDGVSFTFGGVVSGGEDFSAQGDFEGGIKSLGAYLKNDALKGDLMIKGVVDAGPKAVSLNDAIITLAGQKLSGKLSAGLEPISVNGAFSLNEALNLDKIMPAAGEGKGGSPLALTKALPKTLELPVMGAVDVRFNVPGLIYRGERFGAATLQISKAEKAFTLDADLNGVPGNGRIQADVELAFAEKSRSAKSGSDIYSGGAVNAKIKGEAGNFPQMVEALSGMSGLPLVAGSKRGVFDITGHMTPSALYLDNAVINIDGAAYSAKGSMKPQSGSDRPLVTANVVAQSIDFSKLGGGDKGAGGGGASASMPYDLHVDATVHQLDLSGQNVRGLTVGMTMRDNKMVINKIAADSFAGNKINIDSAITVDMGGAKPYLKGSVKLGDLRWRGEKTAAQKTGGEKWSNARMDLTGLNAFNMDFDVSANSIDYEGWVLSRPSIKVHLDGGKLDVESLKAGLFDGNIDASGSVADDGKAVSLSGDAAISSVNIESLMRALTGQTLLKGRGDVNLTTDIAGTGASMKALIGSLNGKGTVSGSDIVIEGIDVQRFVRALSDESKPGDTALHLWKGVGTGGSTAFETLDGSYTVQRGIVNIDKLLLDGPRTAIDTTGQVNLPAWTIATAHKMSVKDRDDVPPFTVKISGSLDNPGNTFAQGAINDYLQRKLERKVQKVLGDKLGETLDKKLGLDGVLKGVLGGGAAGGANAPAAEPAPAPEPEPAPVEERAANDNAAPAPQEESAPAAQEEPKEMTPEDAVNDLLKSFMR